MTELVHPPESLSLPFPPATATELLTRITTQLGMQLSGLRPWHTAGGRSDGVRPCSPPSSPSPTAAATPALSPPSWPSSTGSASSAPDSTSGSDTSS